LNIVDVNEFAVTVGIKRAFAFVFNLKSVAYVSVVFKTKIEI